MKNARILLLLILFAVFAVNESFSTHIVGSTINYIYKGGDTYDIKVTLFRDCRTTGPPIPVAAPNSVVVNVRRGDNTTFQLTSTSRTKKLLELPLPDDPCVREPDTKVCVEQYEYTITSDQFPAGTDYFLFFSLCCRNSTITSLSPEQQTETIYTKIPDRDKFPNLMNAQFIVQPPSYVCGGKPFTVSNLAKDSGDGDRLVYELYTPNAGSQNRIQNNTYVPAISGGFPVFTPVTYSTLTVNGKQVTFSGQKPMDGNEVITADSGKLTFTANIFGQFVVGVKVKEFRGSELISETIRDYQYNVVKCPPEDNAKLALRDVCSSLKVSFQNEAPTADETTFLWNFNDAGKSPKDTSTSKTPTYTFSGPGNYKIKLTVNPGTKCARSDSATIRVSALKAIIASTKDTCAGIAVGFTDKSTTSKNSTITAWRWNFADGKTSTAQNPSNIFVSGGNYNIKFRVTNSIGCTDSVTNVVKIIQEKPDATAGVDDTICKNNPTIALKGKILFAGGGLWKGGLGVFDPDRKTPTAKYTPTTAELTLGSVNLTLLTTLNGKCGADSAKTKLTYSEAPQVFSEISPYADICSNKLLINLLGQLRPAGRGFGVKWTGSGGTFKAGTETTLAPQYTPSAAERIAGQVKMSLTSTNNGECLPVSASSIIKISPAPVVKAGNDTTVCANNADVFLKGSVSLTNNFTWTTDLGDGEFIGGKSILKPTYRPGIKDKQNGRVRIFLSTPAAVLGSYPANCDPVSDTILITISPAPVTTAGTDKIVCANNTDVKLTGNVLTSSGIGTGTWSGGTGKYLPNENSLAITYQPSVAEIAAKTFMLRFTSTNNNKCLAVKDSVNIMVSPAPVVTVGSTQSVCKNNPAIQLSGTVTGGASTGVWSGGKGKYAPDSTSLNAIYTPTTAEVNSGSVSLTLRATNFGTCKVESKNITYTFNDLPKIDAGSPVTVCKNNADAKLNATIIQGAKGVKWSGGGGTFSPSDTVLSPTYKPIQSEINAGKIVLTVSTTGNGNCNAVSDTVSVSFTASPTASVAPVNPVCANNASFQLKGTSSTGKGIWSSTTGGKFFPSKTDLNPTYTPSKADSSAGSVTLKLSTDNNALCLPTSTNVTVTINPAPKVSAGVNQMICSNNPNISLAGSVSGGASTGIWSGGSNNFVGGSTNLAATYVPLASEITAGKVTLTLTSTNNGICSAVSDTATFYFTPAPLLNAGSDLTVCGDVDSVKVLAKPNAVVTAIKWTSDGTGTFGNDAAFATIYKPSINDKDRNSVKITVTSTAQGNCAAVSDNFNLIFSPKSSVDAGADKNFCTADASVQLSASGSVGTWTSTTGGEFTPSANVADAKYIPSAADISAQKVTLTFTSNVVGPCVAVSDKTTITIINSPKITLAANPICADQSANFSPTVENSSSVKWSSTGSGTFSPNDVTLSATYKPSQSEINAGSTTISLRANSNLCASVSKTIVVPVSPKYEVSAGGDQKFCSDIATIQLAGSRSASFPVKWTSTGSGSFTPSDTILTAKYVPTAADLTSSGFDLTLSSNGKNCPNNKSSINIKIIAAPKVNAGADVTICNDNTSVALAATLQNTQAKGGTWSTNAGGIINPNALSAVYFPKANESGKFNFVITTTDNGICNAVKDTLVMTINQKPVISSAGTTKICADAVDVDLSASVLNASGFVWSKILGDGTIQNPTGPNSKYVLDAKDRTSGLVSLKVVSTGNATQCTAVDQTLIIDIQPAIKVVAGGDVTYCANVAQVPLTATVTVADSIEWKTLGSGTFTNIKAQSTFYKPSSLDTANKQVQIVLTAKATSLCKAKSDTMKITFTPVPSITVPSDFDVCADSSFIQLSGTSSTGASSWSSDGSSSFSPNAAAINAKFVPTVADIAKGKIKFTLTSKNNGSCAPVSKDVVVTMTTAPTVSAGSDQVVCADADGVKLNATSTIAGGVKWTSSGNGKFTSTNSATGNIAADTYVLSKQDTIARQVTLTVATVSNGKCKPATDKVVIKITPAPFVNAGPAAVTQCGDLTSVNLVGTIGNSRGGKWTSNGTGRFAPNDSTFTTAYLITSADSAQGKVNIVFSTTGVGTCKTYHDTLKLTIQPAPKVSVMEDFTICADKDTIRLSGTKTVAKGVLWTSTGKGIFAPSADNTDVVYKITKQDKLNGTVKFVMAATGIGTCKPVSDSLTVTITEAPTVDAGIGAEFCASVSSIDLDGSMILSQEGVWRTSGSGTFADSTDLLGKYTPSAADKALKSVVLTLFTKDNGFCKPVSDKVAFTFTPIPEVTVGSDQTVCADVNVFPLTGSFKNAQGGFWVAPVGISGSFEPDNSQSITSYVDTVLADKSAPMTFTYVSFGSGKCAPVSKTMTVKFLPIPVVNASSVQGICSDAPSISLTGSVVNAGTGVWRSTGSGTIVANGQGVDAVYTPTAADIAKGSVQFFLSSKNNNGCKSYTDSVTVPITSAPSIVSIPSHTICADSVGVLVQPNTSNASSFVWSSSSGTGSFSPSSTSKDITFKPSQSQITAGSASLTLTVKGGGTCANSKAVASTIISISQTPKISLSDVSTCQGSATVALNAVKNNNIATAFKWTSLSPNTGFSFTDPTTLATTYNTSAGDQALLDDSIAIRFETTAQGLCKPFVDTLFVHFVPTPNVSAGNDQTICTNVDSVRLNATGSVGFWTKIGVVPGGRFEPNANSLNASYFPSAGDNAAKFVALKFTSTPGGSCTPKEDTVLVTINEGPTFGPSSNAPTCANQDPILVNANNSAGSTIVWYTEGNGIFGDTTLATTTYTPASSDIASGTVTLRAKILDNAKLCKSEFKSISILINKAPEVYAGADFSVCANVDTISLGGKVTNANVGIGVWSVLSTSKGNFVSTNTSSSTKLIDAYKPTIQNVTDNSVQLLLSSTAATCKPVFDTVTIRFTPAPTVKAGSDNYVCGDTSFIPLSGSVTIVSGGQWSHNGLGNFTDTNQVITQYVPNDDERTNGANINFTLSSYQVGTCLSVTDTIKIEIKPKPVLDAGTGVTACGDTSFIQLDGSVANVGGSLWSIEKGFGKFSNNLVTTNVANDKYIPSVADANAGEVILKLITTGNDKCKGLFDFKRIELTPLPKIDAGLDFSVCANNSLINLEGTLLSVATGASWSTTSTGVFGSKADSVVSSFTPSKADSLSGNVAFTLTSKGTGACKPVTDTLKVKITKVPEITINANNIDVCADTSAIVLAGNLFTIAQGITWKSSGTGTFFDPTEANTSYNLSAEDKTKSSLNLIITTDGNGTCLPVSKTIILNIAPKPLIFAGNDTSVCSTVTSIALKGTRNGVITESNWSSDGTASFVGATTGLTASFSPQVSDKDKGQLVFTFASVKQGLCKPVEDVKVVTFEEAPNVKVNAGLPSTICASNSVIPLNGKVENANKSIWSSLTNPSANRGVFEDSLKLGTVYQPSKSELGATNDTSFVTLRLTGFNTIGKCSQRVSSDLLVKILPNPIIEFNDPTDTISVCADKDTIHLSAIAKIAGKPVSGFWTATGTGVFETNAFINTPVYRISESDRTKQIIAFVFKSDGNAGCDTVTKSKILKLIPAVPTADAGSDQTICENNATISLNGKITTASRLGWHLFPVGGTFSPDSNSLQTSFVPLASTIEKGAMKVTLRTHGPSSCSDVKDEMLVNFVKAPKVDINATSVEICTDADSLGLSAAIENTKGAIWTSSGNGQFLPNATTLNAVYIPSADDKVKTSFKLKLTSIENDLCIPVSDSLLVTIRQAPTVSDTAFGTCASQTGIQLQATSSTGSGKWTSNGLGSFSPNPNVANAKYFPAFDDFNQGTVSLVFSSTDNKTCKPASKAININVSPLPIADAGKDQKICVGTSTQIAPASTANILKFTWTPLAGGVSKDSSVITTGVLNADASFVLNVTDARGCKNNDTVKVAVIAKPVLAYASPFCVGDVRLKPSTMPVDTTEGTFQWFRDGVVLASENKSNIVPRQAGQYKNVFAISNCAVSAETKVNPLPVLDGLNRIVCKDVPNLDITMTPKLPANSVYSWSFAKYNTSKVDPIVGTKETIKASVGKDTLVFYASVKDSVGCTAKDSIIVFPVPTPIYTKVIDTTLCTGLSVLLDATPKNIISKRISYLWTPNGDTTATKTVLIPSLAKIDTTNHIVKLTLGECTVSDTATIIGISIPSLNLPDKLYFCSDKEENPANQVVVLDANTSSNVKWSTGDSTRTITVNKEGYYKLTVTNNKICTASDSVLVVEKCKPRVYIPTAFSPNGDNKNDVFRVFGNKFVKNFKIIVFNRWGEIIFYLEDIEGNNVFEDANKVYSWDGDYRGDQMPIGPYPYIVTYEGKEEEFKGPYKIPGSVTIVR